MYPTINTTILPDGNLKITAGNAIRAQLKNLQARGYWSALAELFEPYFTNGGFEPFDAGKGNPFVGLTSVPCIAESMNHEDDGSNVIEGRCWYFDRYMFDDPLDQLRRTGRTIFQLLS